MVAKFKNNRSSSNTYFANKHYIAVKNHLFSIKITWSSKKTPGVAPVSKGNLLELQYVRNCPSHSRLKTRHTNTDQSSCVRRNAGFRYQKHSTIRYRNTVPWQIEIRRAGRKPPIVWNHNHKMVYKLGLGCMNTLRFFIKKHWQVGVEIRRVFYSLDVTYSWGLLSTVIWSWNRMIS